jgi:hypothetical protein
VHRLAVASGLLAFSACAYANAGVGYFMLVIPAMVMSLIAVIPLEGAVFRTLLHPPLGRAMRLSMRANFASTFVGAVIGLALDVALVAGTGSSGMPYMRAPALVMLLPMFGLTWWIEYRSVLRNAPELERRSIMRATAAANAMTYALMAALIWLTYPSRDSSLDRAYLSEGLLAASSMRTEVAVHWHEKKSFPVEALHIEGRRHRVTLGKDGRIALRFTGPPQSPMENKTIYLVPTVTGSELRWACGSNEIELRYLPSTCRDTLP